MRTQKPLEVRTQEPKKNLLPAIQLAEPYLQGLPIIQKSEQQKPLVKICRRDKIWSQKPLPWCQKFSLVPIFLEVIAKIFLIRNASFLTPSKPAGMSPAGIPAHVVSVIRGHATYILGPLVVVIDKAATTNIRHLRKPLYLRKPL